MTNTPIGSLRILDMMLGEETQAESSICDCPNCQEASEAEVFEAYMAADRLPSVQQKIAKLGEKFRFVRR